jgi:hypothetical protein
MGFFSASAERERRERTTPERIVAIAKSKGEFRVSLRYRDDWLRDRCAKLTREGALVGGRRMGREIVFYPAASAASELAKAEGQ